MYLEKCPHCKKQLPFDDLAENYKGEEEFHFQCFGCDADLNIGAEDIVGAADLAQGYLFGWLWVVYEGWMCPACQLKFCKSALKQYAQRSVDPICK